MELSDLRREIDALDGKIVELINKRYEYVIEVGKWKNDKSHAIYVPEREKSLLDRLQSINNGPLPNKALCAIYREIMSGAIALEHPVKIAYLGPENTFSNQAALSKFGRSVNYFPKNSIAEVFEDIEKGHATYGVVPVENSTEGAVTFTLDLFARSNAKICAEINLAAHQNLMVQNEENEIRVIYSHPQAIGQCRRFLHDNYPGIPLVEVRSTAEAARRAAEEPDAAAIASVLAAEHHNLTIIHEKVEDRSDNVTRFLVISRQDTKATGDDKTSLLFVVKDKVGALCDCLNIFRDNGISMTMIESRPSKNENGEYIFFVDFTGHCQEEKVQKLIDDLNKVCYTVKILGSYPANHTLV